MDLLRKEDINWLKEKGDIAINFNEVLGGFAGKIAEAGDSLVIGMFANQINKWLSPKIAENVKFEAQQVFDKIIDGDYEKALIELSDIITAVIANKDINSKFRPWILMIIEIYKGIISQLI